MMYGLIGENSFARDAELQKLLNGQVAEVFDGTEIEPRDLSDILATQTLFSSERVVVVRDASSQKALFDALIERLDQVDDSLTLIIIEAKLDKRTKAYKQLQKHAKVIACDFWSDRQVAKAETWLAGYAKQHGVRLDNGAAANMVRRAIRPSEIDEKPVIDQQLLASAIDQLELVDGTIESDAIDAVQPPVSHDNVFGLLAAALGGDTPRIRHMLEHLRHHQSGHRLLALLASQATNVLMLVLAGNRSVDEVASDIGANSYALNQLAPVAHRTSRSDIERAIELLAQADWRAKNGAEIWGVIETALLSLAETAKQPR